MDNSSNMLQLCRLCLVKDDVNIPIFEEQGDIRQIFLKISSCLPVKVSQDDRLPKKICDGCSYKLDMLYEFWNSSANAEKQLLTWLGEAGMTSQMTDGTISAVAQQIKPADALVKQETIDPPDINHSDDDEDDDKTYMFNKQEEKVSKNNIDEPPPKRQRRTAAVKAAIAMDQNSDDDDDSGEPMTKMEDDSDDSDNDDHEPAFVDVPSTSADDQPGPSGMGKDGVDAPITNDDLESLLTQHLNDKHSYKVLPSKLHKPINCSECDATFLNNLDMGLHSKIHSEKNKFKCHLCKYSGTQKCRFQDHIFNHEGLKKYHCPVCKKQFTSLFRAIKHRIIEHNPKEGKIFKNKFDLAKQQEYLVKPKKLEIPLACKTCNELFDDNVNYAIHINNHNSKSKYYQCHLCKYNNTTEKNVFVTHLLKHEGTNRFKCPLCNSYFSVIDAAITHKLLHKTEAKQTPVTSNRIRLARNEEIKNPEIYLVPPPQLKSPLECKFCQKTFTTNIEFGFHSREHTNLQTYICHICDFQESEKVAFELHIRKHEGIKRFKCPICNKQYQDISTAAEHKYYHNKEKPFSCYICNKKYSASIHLYQHNRIMHSGKPRQEFKCELCSKKYMSAHTLTQHQLIHHKEITNGDESSTLCDICGKVLVCASALRKHKVIHETEKSFACTKCPKTFYNKASLNLHQRAHTKIKPYSCDICGKTFGYNSGYNYHKRLHKGEKPYSCKICEKKFVSSGNMKLHMKSAHKLETHTEKEDN